ncbi:MAG: sigma-70 family RNA polymerase sigma factor [Oligella ureolytica]|nr:sigma-70 family RNA polymerase sigma factor [Oligella ureolytica]
MKRKQNLDKKSLTSWEKKLRSEGLYPEPYSQGGLSLEGLGEEICNIIDSSDWSFVDSIIASITWLTERQKEVLALKCRGYSLNQIAEILKVSRGTVSRILERVEKKIKKAGQGTRPG